MINKKIILGSLLLSLFLILSLNGILAYTYKFQLCNPPTINDSCINYSSVSPVTNAPINGIMYWKDGSLYLTNETPLNYNYTYVTYNVTNVTYVTNSYNLTNGTNVTIIQIQNITANDTLVQQWLSSLNISNSSVFNWSNLGIYTKNETQAALNAELSSVQTLLANYATKADLDALNNALNAKYGYLLAINSTGINGTINLNEINNGGGFDMTWKVIIIIIGVLVFILIIMFVRSMMSG
jgi:hypothetical protein